MGLQSNFCLVVPPSVLPSWVIPRSLTSELRVYLSLCVSFSHLRDMLPTISVKQAARFADMIPRSHWVVSRLVKSVLPLAHKSTDGGEEGLLLLCQLISLSSRGHRLWTIENWFIELFQGLFFILLWKKTSRIPNAPFTWLSTTLPIVEIPSCLGLLLSFWHHG